MFLRGIQSDGWNWVLFLCLFILSKSPVTAQLSLSTTGGVQCYGEQVTLLCTHPVLPQEPEYLQAEVTWRRDGRAISSVGLGRTNPTSTKTKLEFTITSSTVGNYTCFLVNVVQSRADESNSVTVRPPDLTPPPLTTIDSLASTITLKWSDQPCTVRYSVSWMYTNDDGTTTTDSGVTELTNYTIPTSVGGVYTVSVEAVGGVGIVGPSTTQVVRSTLPRPTAPVVPCKDRSVVLRCQVSGQVDYERYIWRDSRGEVVDSDLYNVEGQELTIADVCAVRGMLYRCGGVLSSGTVVMGESYRVEPLAQPGPPVVTITTTDSSVTLIWNTTLHCFESKIFTFVVIWNEIGSGTSNNVTISSPPYTISGLQPGTSYEVSVHGVSGSGLRSSRSVSLIATSPVVDTGLSTGVIASVVIGSVVVSVMIFIAGCGAGVIAILVYQKTSKQTTKSSESEEDKATSSTPGYMNVELEDKSVPMTDNPSYEPVQRTQLTKPLYGNL